MADDAARSKSYFDPRIGSVVSMVTPGDCAVTGEFNLALSTLLGSCVAACICDPVRRIGGLNHFLLPDDGAQSGADSPAALRYGVHAMEVLINELLKRGAARERLEAKLFGGANVIALSGASNVGARNAAFAEDFLRREGIPLRARDVGGERGRRIFFRAAENRVLVQFLDRADAQAVRSAEDRLRRATRAAPRSGGVELF